MRSPTEISMSIARGFGRSEIRWARSTRSSVVSPIAERDRHDPPALLLGGDDPASDVQQPLRVADRGTAELQHERADAPRVVAGDVWNGLVVGRRHVAQKAYLWAKKPTKNVKPADPRANRFDSGESNRPDFGIQGSAAQKAAICDKYSHLAAAGQRAAERDLVGVLEVAADGQPAREPGDADAVSQPVGEVGGGRLAGHVRVGREHDLADPVPGDALEQLVDRRSDGSTPSIGESAPPSTW
jgi:hypothetical protein